MKIIFPLENYKVNGNEFGQKVPGWGIHLGDDCNAKEGTLVKAIANGEVVYSALHPGTSRKRNWGNIIVIRHTLPKEKKIFYSLYAHLGKRLKNFGDKVKASEIIGYVGEADTAENGWWRSHLHFAIYTGMWKEEVLPGYFKKEQKRTRLTDWKNPARWIKKYSQ